MLLHSSFLCSSGSDEWAHNSQSNKELSVMSGGGEETYLEAFVDQLTSLPHDLRRSLELLKSLDGDTDLARLKELQQRYVTAVERKICGSLQVTEMSQVDGDGERNDSGSSNAIYGVTVRQGDASAEPQKPFRPTTQELFTFTYDEEMYTEIQVLQKQCLQKADEKCAVASQAYEMINQQIQKLESDMAAIEPFLKATGDLQPNAARPDDMAACQIVPGSEWILAKVVEHDPMHGTYKVADEDVESNKIFDLPESQVIVLQASSDWSKGESIYAVYPDTTSFYPATITQSPKKGFAVVTFSDDSDEFGVTTPKSVPIHHIMSPPDDS